LSFTPPIRNVTCCAGYRIPGSKEAWQRNKWLPVAFGETVRLGIGIAADVEAMA
jgi:hypothetical protein